jgi:hypothetical protein
VDTRAKLNNLILRVRNLTRDFELRSPIVRRATLSAEPLTDNEGIDAALDNQTVESSEITSGTTSICAHIASMSRFSKFLLFMRAFDLLSDIYIFIMATVRSLEGDLPVWDISTYSFALLFTFALYRQSGIRGAKPEVLIQEDLLLPFISATSIGFLDVGSRLLIAVEFVMIAVNCHRSTKVLKMPMIVRLLVGPTLTLQSLSILATLGTWGPYKTMANLLALLISAILVPDCYSGKTSPTAMVVSMLCIHSIDVIVVMIREMDDFWSILSGVGYCTMTPVVAVCLLSLLSQKNTKIGVDV